MKEVPDSWNMVKTAYMNVSLCMHKNTFKEYLKNNNFDVDAS